MAENFGDAVISWMERKVEALTDDAKEVIVETGEDIKELTVYYIENRGTAKSGKQGRIETGAMRDSVDFEVTENTANSIQVRAGYHDAPFYTVFQELGTRRIEAMEALVDAAEVQRVIMERRLSATMKGSA